MSGSILNQSSLLAGVPPAAPAGSVTPVNFQNIVASTVNVAQVRNTRTTSYTPVFADYCACIEMDSSSPTTITIPTNTSVAWPVGVWFDICQIGTGSVSIVAGTDAAPSEAAPDTRVFIAGPTINASLTPGSVGSGNLVAFTGGGGITVNGTAVGGVTTAIALYYGSNHSAYWVDTNNIWSGPITSNSVGSTVASQAINPFPPAAAIAVSYTTLVFYENCSANSINYNGTYTPVAGSPTNPRWFTQNGETSPLTSAQAFMSSGQISIVADNSGFTCGLTSGALHDNTTTHTVGTPMSTPTAHAAGGATGLQFQYGYFEASMKSAKPPSGPATGWWIGSAHSDQGQLNNANIEIDFIEINSAAGQGLTCGFFNWLTGGGSNAIGRHSLVTVGGSQGFPSGWDQTAFHTYGCLWTPTSMSMYTDNTLNYPSGAVAGSGTGLLPNPITASTSPPNTNYPQLIGPAGTGGAALLPGIMGTVLIIGATSNTPAFFKEIKVWQ